MTVALALTAAFLLLGASRVHWTLAWLACALIAVALSGSNRRRAATAGALFVTTAGLVLTVPWVGETTADYFSISRSVGIALASAMMVAYGASWGALLGIGLRGALRLRIWLAIPAFGAVWATWEAAQLAVFPHHPWLSIAALHAIDAGAILQCAALGGQGLIVVLAAAGGCAAALGVGRRSLGALAAGILLLTVPLAFGTWRAADATGQDESSCSVLTVDAGIAPMTAREQTLERYAALTRGAVGADVDAVIWPESALPGYPESDSLLRRQIRSVATDTGAILIAGGPRVAFDGRWQPRNFNSAYRIPANGPLRTYDKRALAPFAEDWPGGAWLRPAAIRADQVEAGSTPAVFEAGDCRLGIMICFESDHPWVARSSVEAGATALLVLSNDAQLTPTAVDAEIAQARLRAVETGLPLLRAANRGTTIAIDRCGQTRAMSRGVTMRFSFPGGDPAPADRTSSLVLLACAVLAVIALREGVKR